MEIATACTHACVHACMRARVHHGFAHRIYTRVKLFVPVVDRMGLGILIQKSFWSSQKSEGAPTLSTSHFLLQLVTVITMTKQQLLSSSITKIPFLAPFKTLATRHER